MRFLPRDGEGLRQIILADGATALTLPYPPLTAQLPMGFEVQVDDNTGAFAGANMVVTGPINGVAVTTATLSTANSRTGFMWVGDRYLQK
jgi:hypothetical protein